jgi:hypothetical protein
MKIRLALFNIYFCLVFVTVLAISCRTPEERRQAKEASTIRVFLARAGGKDGNATIYRQTPMEFRVEREALLSEADLEAASVIEVPGGFAISAQFDGHGAMKLEGATVAHKGEHFAIQSNFGETRWLAAPVINRRISNGQLVFTPDATREEADRIVRGLTNVVKLKKARSFID